MTAKDYLKHKISEAETHAINLTSILDSPESVTYYKGQADGLLIARKLLKSIDPLITDAAFTFLENNKGETVSIVMKFFNN